MVLGRKTNFFLGKTKKNKKNHLLGNYAAKLQQDSFFGFPSEKVGFSAQNHLFLGKSWFFCPKPSFS